MSACLASIFVPQEMQSSLQEKRPTVSPKPGFIGQLLALEEQLGIEPASPRTAEASSLFVMPPFTCNS